MPELNQPNQKPDNKPAFFDYLFEVIGWLQIVFSLLILGLIVGLIIYFSNPGTFRLLLGIAVTLAGLIAGIVIADKAWKNKGTIDLVSRVSATPELDNLEDK